MAIYYKGTGVGTHWHINDARANGFVAQNPALPPTLNRLMHHIARGAVISPYISLTHSYGVAWSYAMSSLPTPANPAYIYEIELNAPLPAELDLFDPVKEIVTSAPFPPVATHYHHDGLPEFLLGVVSPSTMMHHLLMPAKQPPPGIGAKRPANLMLELEALVWALRDAEALAVGTISANRVVARHNVP